MTKFQKFCGTISNLKFADNMILRGVGLNHLYKFYDAYPTQHEGERLFFLLPRGMDPKAVAGLTESAAAKQVLILQQKGRGVAKIWPSQAEAPSSNAAEALQSEAGPPAINIEFVDE